MVEAHTSDGDFPVRVGEQLGRMLESDAFNLSDRNANFLRYIIDEALAGRGDRIKAYSIATDVFGRGPDFDPQSDPLVRIEARRIRRALDMYYLTEGKLDPIRLSIPKGRYVPEFDDRGPAYGSVSTGDSECRKRPSIVVMRFDQEEMDGQHQISSGSFARQIVVGLSKFTNLMVFGPDHEADYSDCETRKRLIEDCKADYVVAGGALMDTDRASAELVLVDPSSGRVLWGQSFERRTDDGEIAGIRTEIVNEVVRVLAEPFGVIFGQELARKEGRRTSQTDVRDCLIKFQEYIRNLDPETFTEAVICLEEALQQDPEFAEGTACLSQLYTDAYRFGHTPPVPCSSPLDHALTLARRAITLAPHSSRAFHSLAVAFWFTGDTAASIETYRTALNLNPNAIDTMADLGMRLAFLAQWEDAIPILESAFRLNPALNGSYRIGIALHHFVSERYEDALTEVRKLEAPNVVYGYLLEAAALSRLNRLDEARDRIEILLRIDPDYGDHIREDLRKRYVDSTISDELVSALRSAGLSPSLGAVASLASN